MVDMAVIEGCGTFIVVDMSAVDFYFGACDDAVVVDMAIIKSSLTIDIVCMAGYIGIAAGYSRIFMCMPVVYAGYAFKVMRMAAV